VFILKMILLLLIINILYTRYFNNVRYISIFMGNVNNGIKRIFGNFLFVVLFLFILYQNLYGNIFYCLVPTLYYVNTIHISLTYFIPIIVIMLSKQYVNFVKHIIPYGAPLWLFIILPLIEAFRFVIRPLTLCIRLSTNLCAGHIIIYMLSNFALAIEIPNISIHLVVMILRILEFVISILQAYIFCNPPIPYHEEI
jgi:F-type H+-transporting ATPase subunit a